MCYRCSVMSYHHFSLIVYSPRKCSMVYNFTSLTARVLHPKEVRLTRLETPLTTIKWEYLSYGVKNFLHEKQGFARYGMYPFGH